MSEIKPKRVFARSTLSVGGIVRGKQDLKIEAIMRQADRIVEATRLDTDRMSVLTLENALFFDVMMYLLDSTTDMKDYKMLRDIITMKFANWA